MAQSRSEMVVFSAQHLSRLEFLALTWTIYPAWAGHSHESSPTCFLPLLIANWRSLYAFCKNRHRSCVLYAWSYLEISVRISHHASIYEVKL